MDRRFWESALSYDVFGDISNMQMSNYYFYYFEVVRNC